MPAATPIYSFPYPCPGETVDATAFANLANAIDTKLLDVFNDEDLALNRYNVIQRMTPSQSGIAASVNTALTNPNATYVTPIAGVYIVVSTVSASATTITSCRTRITLNAVAQFGKTFNNETGSAAVGEYTISGAPVVAAAGDTIGGTFFFTGTGTATVAFDLHVSLLVRIA